MLDQLAAKVMDGGRVDSDEAVQLYRDAPTHLLGRLADAIRARKHPDRLVTYIIDRNVNYTNVCVARCNFCAFYRPVGSGEGYVLGFDEIFRKIDETIAVGGNQLLLQGGHNPDLPDCVVRGPVSRREGTVPGVQAPRAVATGSAAHFAAQSGAGSGGDRASGDRRARQHSREVALRSSSTVFGRLLNCYGKASADEWLDVMRAAHRAGLDLRQR